MTWLRNWWWARQRRMDLLTLWPECKRLAPTLDQAKAIFVLHAVCDPAWARHYGERLWAAIDELS